MTLTDKEAHKVRGTSTFEKALWKYTTRQYEWTDMRGGLMKFTIIVSGKLTSKLYRFHKGRMPYAGSKTIDTTYTKYLNDTITEISQFINTGDESPISSED